MTDECGAEEARLVNRTAALRTRTQELALTERPFSQAEHDELKAQLAEHKADLAAFRKRCLGIRD
jgi:hypothetical protein